MCSAWTFTLTLFLPLPVYPSLPQCPSFFLPLLEKKKKNAHNRHTLERERLTLWVSPVIITEAAAAQWRQRAAVQRANRLRPSHTWIIDQCDSEMTARGNRTALLWGGSVLYPRCRLPRRDACRLKRRMQGVGRDWDSSVVRERGAWCGFFRCT